MNLPNDEEAYYSKDGNLKATISMYNDTWYVDFFKNEVLINYRSCKGHSIHYARSMAENYCNGILKIDSLYQTLV